MLLLKVLSGKEVGSITEAREFPWKLGRAASSNLVLTAPGVWDEHAEIILLPGEGFHLRANAEALTTINGKPALEGRLRNGDMLGIAGEVIQIFLSSPQPGDLRCREAVTWLGLLILLAAQVYAIYWLSG